MKAIKYGITILLALLIFISSVGAVVISSAFSILGDISYSFENSIASASINMFTEALQLFYETGQMREYNKYFDDLLSEEVANSHRGLFIIPCVILRQEPPDKEFVQYLENSLIDNGEIVDISIYADAIMNNPHFEFPSMSVEFLINVLELGDNYSLYLSGHSSSLPDDYINMVGQGFSYPFTKKYSVTAHVGMYNPFGEWKGHNGTDFGAPLYTPVYAVKSGKVVATGTKTCSYDNASQAGCNVQVLTSNGLLVKYYHFARASHLKVGDEIKTGDLVGVVGSTGYSTGPHLHLEIRQYTTNKVLDYCQFMNCDDPVLPDVD